MAWAGVPPPSAPDVVEHSGTISAQTTWTADQVHVIDNTVTVASGVILTIEAGAIIKTRSGGLQVDGAVVAAGTSSDPIVFTSWEDDSVGGDTNLDGYSEGEPGQWGGVRFRDASIDSQTVFEHVQIRYGGWSGALEFDRASPTVRDVTVEHAHERGIYVIYGSPIVEDVYVSSSRYSGFQNHYGSPTVRRLTSTNNGDHGLYTRHGNIVIEEVTLTDNGGWGLYFYDTSFAPVIRDSVITGNRYLAKIPVTAVPGALDGNVWGPNEQNILHVRGRSRTEDLQLSVLSGANGAEVRTYRFEGGTSLSSGSNLWVDPGVVIKVAGGGNFDIQGDTTILGTPELPVVITSIHDDTEGGDSEENGYARGPRPGLWDRITLRGTNNEIRHARIGWGGSSDYLVYVDNSALLIEDSAIFGSKGDGIWSQRSDVVANNVEIFGNERNGVRFNDGSHQLTMTNSRVYANGDHGLRFTDSTGGTISGSEFFANDNHAIRADNATISAGDNWWGAADGPGGSYGGSGDEIDERVDLTWMGLLDDYRTTGTRFSMYRAGEPTHEGTESAAAVMGTPSTELGGLLFDLDAVSVAWGALDPAVRWQLMLVERNDDGVESSRINSQRVIGADGEVMREAVEVARAAVPGRTVVPVQAAQIVGGELAIDVVRADGARAALMGAMVFEPVHSTDVTAPSIAITSPEDADAVSGHVWVEGTASDAESGVHRVEVGVVEQGEVVWHPVLQLRTDGSWVWRDAGATAGARTYRARVWDRAGTVAHSADVTTQWEQLAPAPVRLLSAVDEPGDSGGAVRVSWQPSADDGGGAQDVVTYVITRRRTQGVQWSEVGTVAGGTTTLLDATVDGEMYRYAVVAVDQSGLVSARVESGDITSVDNSLGDNVAPEEVSSLSASAGPGSAYVTWSPSADTAGDLVSQWIDISVDAGLSWGTNAPDYNDGGSVDVGPAATSWSRHGLTDGVQHLFRVRVVDGSGNVSPGVQTGVVTPSANSGMTLSGVLSADVELDAGVWHVTNNLTIPSGRTLRIGPGAILKFGPYGLYVRGLLLVEGTASNPVVFTSITDDSVGGDTNGDGASTGSAGQWNGIRYEDSCIDHANVVRHAEVRFAGRIGGGSLNVDRCTPRFEDVLVRDGSSNGVHGSSSSASLLRVTVQDHAGSGAYFRYNSPSLIDSVFKDNGSQGLDSDASAVLVRGCEFTGNTLHGVYFRSGTAIEPFVDTVITGNGISMRVPFSGVPSTSDGNVLTPNGTEIIKIVGNTRTADLDVAADSTLLLVSGDMIIARSARMTIGEGTLFKSSSGRVLVNGGLKVLGSAGSQVLFTSLRDDTAGGDHNGDGPSNGGRGDWDYLQFAADSLDWFNLLEHTELRFAGRSTGALYLDYAAPTVRDLVIRESGDNGVHAHRSRGNLERVTVDGADSSCFYEYYEGNSWTGLHGSGCTNGFYSRYAHPDLVNSTFEDNSGWGIYFYDNRGIDRLVGVTSTGNRRSARIPVSAMPNVGDGAVLVPNEIDGVFLLGATRSEPLHLGMQDDGAGNTSSTFVVTGTITMAAPLTIEPGMVLKFESGSGLQIQDEATIDGTAAQPIVFTASTDDTWGGDTNDDGFASFPHPGAWNNIRLVNDIGGPTEMSHVRVLYAGSADDAAVHSDSRVFSLTDAEVAYSRAHGVRAYRGVPTYTRVHSHSNALDGFRFQYLTATITDSIIEGNRDDGVQFTHSSGGTISGSRIRGNLDWGVHSDGPNVDARGNWWGAVDGPSGDGPGSGDSVGGSVSLTGMLPFDDFLTEGPGYAYIDLGPNTTRGNMAAPTVLRGTESTQFGTTADKHLLYDPDRVQVNFPGLTDATRLDLVTAHINGDTVAGEGNRQHVEDGSGVVLQPEFRPHASVAQLLRTPVPGASFASGQMQVDVVRDNGFRATWSQAWLFEVDDPPDLVSPVVGITNPVDGQRIAGDTWQVVGTASDDVRVTLVEIGVDAGAGPVWRPATNLNPNDVWEYRWVLPADGTYTLSVRARDAFGNITTSTDIGVVVDNTAPQPPTAIAAWDTPGDAGGALTVGWTLSTDDGAGDDDVDGYRIERSTDSGVEWTLAGTVPAGVESWTDAAAGGETWLYRVVAIDQAGNESLSEQTPESSAIDNLGAGDTTPPEDVTNLTGVAGDAFVRLSWTESVDSAADLVDYLVDVSVDGGATFGITSPGFADGDARVLRKGLDATEFDGLVNGNGYRFRVRARDAAGNISGGSLTNVVAPSNTAYTSVSGTLTQDTTWGSGVYVISSRVTVNSGVTLTVAPGAVVKFDGNRSLYVRGVLDAVGTEEAPVVFTSIKDDEYGGDSNDDGLSVGEAGDWGRIEFDDPTSNGSRMEHAVVRFGGGDGAANLHFVRSSPTFEHVEISHSGRRGIDAYQGAPTFVDIHVHNNVLDGVYGRYGTMVVEDALVELNGSHGFLASSQAFKLRDVVVRDNAKWGVIYTDGNAQAEFTRVTVTGNANGVRMPFHTLPSLGDGSDVTGNDSDVVQVYASSLQRDVDLDPGLVYRQLGGNARIDTGYTLRMAPGTSWLMGAGGRFEVDGALVAVGTAEAPIVFSSDRDDSVAGDVNGDGPSAGGPGQWAELSFDDPSIDFLSRLEHVQIRFGGQGTASLVVNRANPVLADVDVSYSSTHGVYLEYSNSTLTDVNSHDNAQDGFNIYAGAPSFERVISTNNADEGLQTRYALPTIVDSEITDNEGWGIYDYDNRGWAPPTGTRITGNRRAMRVGPDVIPEASDGNTLVPNQLEGLWVIGGERTRDLRLAVEVDAEGNSLRTLRFQGNMSVRSTATLSIEPGMVLKFPASAQLTLYGGVDVVGTPADPVVFTSVDDDAAAGDVDANGPTAAAPGAWNGIHIYNGAMPALMENVVIRYGGSNLGSSLYVDTRVATLRSVDVSRSSSHGIRLYRGGVTLENVDSYLNHWDGLHVTSSGIHDVTGGRFYFNHDDGMDYRSGTTGTISGAQIFGNLDHGLYADQSLSAAGNWWGTSDGPGGEGPGSGSLISANVDISYLGFDDFLTDGSEFSFVDLGGSRAGAYGASLPIVSGTASTEWGTELLNSVVYDSTTQELTAAWASLAPGSSYTLFVSHHNRDAGTNTVQVEDVGGYVLQTERALPNDRAVTWGSPVPRPAFSTGSLDLSIRAPQGGRVAAAALWLVEDRVSDANGPVVTLDEPADNTLVGAAGVTLRGTALDGEGQLASLEVGFTPDGGAETWTQVSNLGSNGVWTHPWTPTTGAWTVRVRATDGGGNTAETAPLHIFADTDLPGPVQDLAAFSVGNGIRVVWSASVDDGAGDGDVATYEVSRATSFGGPWTVLGTTPAGTSRFDDTNVVLGDRWFYQVVAVDLAGNPSPREVAGPAEATLEFDTVPPEDPTDLVLSPTHVDGVGSAWLTWTASADSANDLVDYRVSVSADGGLTWGATAPAFDDGLEVVVPKRRTSMHLQGLEIGPTYRVRVTAADAVPNISSGIEADVTVTGAPNESVALSGTLSEDLSLGKGVFRVTGTLTVPDGRTLEMLPGAILKFANSYDLVGQGVVRILGTDAEPVVLTSLADDEHGGDTNVDGPSTGTAGDWGEVRLDYADAGTEMKHVLLRFAGRSNKSGIYSYRTPNLKLAHVTVEHVDNHGIYLREGTVSLRDSHVRDAGGSCVYLYYGTPPIEGNTFERCANGVNVRYGEPYIATNLIQDNAGWGVYFHDSRNAPVLQGNTIIDNARAFMVPASALPDESNVLVPNTEAYFGLRSGTLPPNARLRREGVGTGDEVNTWVSYGSLTVGRAGSLRVDEGVVFKMSGAGQIRVDGLLQTDGTRQLPITLTSVDDDSVGHPMSDGTSMPRQGAWNGVYYEDSAFETQQYMRHTRVRFAGSGGNGNIYVYRTPVLFEDIEVSGSSSFGMYVRDSAATVTGAFIWGNASDGVRWRAAAGSLTFSSMVANGSDGVQLQDGGAPLLTNNRIYANLQMGLNTQGIAVDASNTWWGEGDGSGPFGTDNPSGTGAEIGDNTTFEPFETTAPVAWAYMDLGPTVETDGNLPTPALAQGELSADWGTDPARTMAHDPAEVVIDFTGLDASRRYRVLTTYLNGDGGTRLQRLDDGAGNSVHGPVVMPSQPGRIGFDVPPSYYATGDLSLAFVNHDPSTSFRAAIPQVWLVEDETARAAPRFESVAYDDRDGSGGFSVGDQFVLAFSDQLDTAIVVDGTQDADEHLPAGGSWGTPNAIEWRADQSTVVITLTDGFTVAGGGVVTPSGLTNVAGVEASGTQVLPTEDTVAPGFVGLSWVDVDGDEENSLGDQHVFVFSERMDTDAIMDGTQDANSRLRPQGGARYGASNTVQWSADGTTVSVTVTEGYSIVGDELVVPSNFVTDVAGNPSVGVQRLQGRDSTAPTLTAVAFDDRDGDGVVSIGDRYRFSFDEPMQASSLSDFTTEANVNLNPAGASYGTINRVSWNSSITVATVDVTQGFTVMGGETVTPSAFLRDRADNPVVGTAVLPVVDTIAPSVESVQANFISPVSATDAYRLTVRFDSAMDPANPPLVTLTSSGATDPSVPSTGSWLTTRYPNDTWTTDDIVLAEGMDGTLTGSVFDAGDVAGNALADSPGVFTALVDATRPSSPLIGLTAQTCSTATYIWPTYTPPPDLGGFYLYLSADEFHDLDGRTPTGFIPPSATSWQLSGLSAGTTTWVAIVAFDTVGNVDNVVEPVPVTIDKPTPPAIALSASAAGDADDVRLSWHTYDTSELCGLGGFEVYREAGTFGDITGLTPVQTLSADDDQVVVGGLDRTATTWFAVVAFTDEGDKTTAVTPVSWSDPYAGELVTDLTIGGGEDSEIDILENITVRPGATLTIEPGTTLHFADGRGLFVDGGRVVARGTAYEPIVMTSVLESAGTAIPGSWVGVRLLANADSSVLEQVHVRYGEGVLVDGSEPTIESLTAEHNSGAGLEVRGGGQVITDSALLRYNDVGIRAVGAGVIQMSHSVIKYNTGNGAENGGGTILAADNWWGSLDETAVDGMVTAGVNYLPLLDGEPVLDPVADALDGVTTVGTQSVVLALPSRNADEVRISEDSLFAGTFYEPWERTRPFTLSPGGGEKVVWVQYRSISGVESTPSAVSFDLNTDGPSIDSFSLVDGETWTRPGLVTATASADQGVSSMQLSVGNTVVWEVSGGSLTYRWDVRDDEDGVYRVELRAVDTLGNEAIATRNIIVSRAAPPAPVIVQPTDGIVLSSGPVNVLGTAEPFVEVQVRRDGAVIGTPVADAAGAWRVDAADLLEGENTFTAVAADAVGLSASSAPHTVVLDTGAPPAPVLLAATSTPDGVNLTWRWADAGEAPDFVEIYRSPAPFSLAAEASRIRDEQYGASYLDDGASDGTWYYGIVGVDVAGNSSVLSNVLQTVVDRSPAVLTISYNPSSPVGVGPVSVHIESDETLVDTPDVVIRPHGSNIPLSVSLVQTGDRVWDGVVDVTAVVPSGAADVRATTRDVAGNVNTSTPVGETLFIDTAGPRATVETDPEGPVQILAPVSVQVDVFLDEPAKVGTVPSLSYVPPQGASVSVPLLGTGSSFSGVLQLEPTMGRGDGYFVIMVRDALDNLGEVIAAGRELEIYDSATPDPTQRPRDLVAASRPGGIIELEWPAVNRAETYAVYRRDGDCSEFPSQVLIAGLTDTEFVDTPPHDGVWCYAITTGRYGAESELSLPVPALSDRVAPPAPDNVTVALDTRGVLVAWEPGVGEVPYRFTIYRNGSAIRTVDPWVTELANSPPNGGNYTYEVAARDIIGNEARTAAPILNLAVGAVRDLEVVVADGEPPTLTWVSSDSAAVGFNVYRGGVKVSPGLLVQPEFTDAFYSGSTRFRYDVRAVNAAGQESPPRLVDVWPMTLDMRMNVRADEPGPARSRLFNTLEISARNKDVDHDMPVHAIAAAVTTGGLPLVQREQEELLSVVNADGTFSSNLVVPFGEGTGAHIIDAEVIYEDGLGARVRYQRSFSESEARPPVQPVTVTLDEVPIAGGLANANVCVTNQGHAEMQFRVASAGGAEPGDVALSILNDDGLEISRTEYLGFPMDAPLLYADSDVMVQLPSGNTTCMDIEILVPFSVQPGDDILFRAIVDPTWHDRGFTNVQGLAPLEGTMSSGITLAEYYAEVTTDRLIYTDSDTVLISGQARAYENDAPVPDAPVKVGLFTRGFKWYLDATTDANGEFTVEYVPSAGLAGDFVTWGAHPDVVDVIEQARFALYRLFTTPAVASFRSSKAYTAEFNIGLYNPGSLPLTGGAMAFRAYTIDPNTGEEVDTPEVTGTAAIPALITPNGSTTVYSTLTASIDAPDALMVEYLFTTTEGASYSFEASVDLLPAIPVLRVESPSVGYVDQSVDTGTIETRTVTVKNTGLDVLRDAVLEPPTDVDWITTNLPLDANGHVQLGDIEVGEEVDFDVVMAPPPTAAFGYTTGTFVITGSNAQQPIEIQAWALVTSQLRGSVAFTVNSNVGQPVPGASIKIFNNDIFQEYNVETDFSGVAVVPDLNLGVWTWQSVAPGHRSVSGVVDVLADQVVDVEAYMDRSLVTINFVVEPVTFTDTYQITIEQTFVTQVPEPVLVVDPPYSEFQDVPDGFEATIMVTLTNEGLKAVDDIVINGDEIPVATMDPLVTFLPRLGPMESVIIPMRVKYRGDGADDGEPAALGGLGSCLVDNNPFVDAGIIPAFGNLLAAMQGRSFSFFSDAERAIAIGAIAAFLTIRSINLTPGPVDFLVYAAKVASCMFGSTSDPGGGQTPSHPTTSVTHNNVGCFAAGTPVLTADGERVPIESVKAGDWVMGEDGTPTQVEQAYVQSSKHLRELRYSRGEDTFLLQTTDEHRFWVESSKSWQRADTLVVGDVLRLADGEEAHLVATSRSEELVQVYNLDVAEGVGFFANDLLAHERCDAEESPEFFAVAEGVQR